MKPMTKKEFEDWKIELLERVDLASDTFKDQMGFIISLLTTMPSSASSVLGEYELLLYSLSKLRSEIKELRRIK